VALIASETEDAMAESELFERGLQRRREVLGSEYVDANLRDSDEFMMAFQRAVTEVAWGIAYCGTPAGRQAFLAAHRALSAEGALG
jgi:alkylhydroperoxidase/carboxymuconolactone decarboxylase family protein YurZ